MDEEIKQLLEKNLEISGEILSITKKIKSVITFQKIMSAIYFFLIVVPIILSLIYLPPIIKDFFGQYQQFLDVSSRGIK